MKFKIGNKVEVLRRTKEQANSWFPGIITSVDGYQCIVKYEQFLNSEGDPVVEKVNQQDVRPEPPTTKAQERWMVGDIAEVFDVHCWKVGKVAKVLKSNQIVIRLVGSIQLKEFHQSSLRNRQAWKNNKWVMIGKVIDVIDNSPKLSVGLGDGAPQQGMQEEYNSRVGHDEEHLKTSHHARTLKRNYDCHFDEVVGLGSKKRKIAMKAGKYNGLPLRTLPLSTKQVDGAEANVGKSCMLGYSEQSAEVEKARKYLVHPFSMPAHFTEDSNGCSVASCSSNYLPEYRAQTTRKPFKDIADSTNDDAESWCPYVSLGEFLPSEVALAANVHELELHAYRRTLHALYASGPLSWEQESLLTNLRLSLHITNEEHLLLLRQLLSTQDY